MTIDQLAALRKATAAHAHAGPGTHRVSAPATRRDGVFGTSASATWRGGVFGTSVSATWRAGVPARGARSRPSCRRTVHVASAAASAIAASGISATHPTPGARPRLMRRAIARASDHHELGLVRRYSTRTLTGDSPRRGCWTGPPSRSTASIARSTVRQICAPRIVLVTGAIGTVTTLPSHPPVCVPDARTCRPVSTSTRTFGFTFAATHSRTAVVPRGTTSSFWQV